MKKMLVILFVMLTFQACSKEIDKGIKSPCVSYNYIDKYGELRSFASSPCGDRIPVNTVSRVET